MVELTLKDKFSTHTIRWNVTVTTNPKLQPILNFYSPTNTNSRDSGGYLSQIFIGAGASMKKVK